MDTPIKKEEVWVIGDFVSEPTLSGIQIGEVGSLDMSKYEVTQRFSQEEYDQILNDFFDEHGYYPGD